MRELDSLLRLVIPYAPSCPEPVALLHLMLAARVFCEQTLCWREVDTIETAAEPEQLMCVPPHADLHRIERALFDGKPLEAAAYTDVALAGLTGRPRYFTQAHADSLTIVPAAAGSLTLSLILKPALDADVLPDFMLTQHGQALAAGALSTLMALPNQPFSNPSMAGFYAGQFQQAMNTNFSANRRGQQRAATRTKARWI